MASVDILKNENNITFAENEIITITKKTIRFSKTIYQTHNVSGLGEGEISRKIIPWFIVIAVFCIGLIVGTYDSEIGSYLIIFSIIGIFINFIKTKNYGLLLTLNSGDKALFITRDRKNLRLVIEEIYKTMEEGGDTTYQISIQNSRVSGNFIQGSVKGDALYQ